MRVKTIPNMGGRYSATENGDIYSLYSRWGKRPKPRKMTPQVRKDGYLQLILTLPNGRKKDYLVHRLIALTFLRGDSSQLEVNHKDGNRRNNCVGNLEWVDRRENMAHRATILNTAFSSQKTTPIVCVELNELWLSIASAARNLGVNVGNIQQSLKTGCRCKGFHWIRAEEMLK